MRGGGICPLTSIGRFTPHFRSNYRLCKGKATTTSPTNAIIKLLILHIYFLQGAWVLCPIDADTFWDTVARSARETLFLRSPRRTS